MWIRKKKNGTSPNVFTKEIILPERLFNTDNSRHATPSVSKIKFSEGGYLVTFKKDKTVNHAPRG
jgi:hypothetical protein